MTIRKNSKLDTININEALRYLGYGNNQPDETIRNLLDQCEKELLTVARPSYIYQGFDFALLPEGILVNGTRVFLEGQDIKNHLEGCEKVILLCATLSIAVDKLIGIYQIKDLNRALLIDSLASAAIEQVCDAAQESIQSENKDYFSTWRYGIGYGDLSLDSCHAFLETLNTSKHIGVYATENNLLIPKKTVVCIIGLSKKEIRQKKRSCLSCNLKDRCTYRRKGERCEF